MAYVGNSTHHELLGEEVGGAGGVASGGFVNQNKIPLGGLFKPDPVTGAPAPKDPENNSTFNVEDYEPYSGCTAGGGCYGYGTNGITVGTHTGYGNYNGLQIAWLKQRGHASWDFNYTWSKALGILETTFDAFNLRNNYGVLDIDQPQVFNASVCLQILPVPTARRPAVTPARISSRLRILLVAVFGSSSLIRTIPRPCLRRQVGLGGEELFEFLGRQGLRRR